ncbi:hypothetical protein [uncultured Methylobacterium sp.]|uniref:pPIWI_RE_Z domain-containing protein n=1 Tax=uncultured Methylobacterium sp. TaxID=157278 RepID=UPI0035CA0B28
MRSDREYLAAYRDALSAIDPDTRDLDGERVRTLAQTELCLAYLHRYLPDEPHRSVPFLMMGYPKLLDGAGGPGAIRSLMTVRHLCSRFGSISAWVDAILQYGRTPEALRCFEVRGTAVSPRRAAPAVMRELLDTWLDATVPWTRRELNVALPGDATVVLDRTRTTLAYTIPAVPAERRARREHALRPRASNPPIQITFEQMREVALKVDTRETLDDWPAESLPPLRLASRIANLQPKGLDGFYEDGTFNLDGATHVVGMLSSGKSTLVWALLMALTLGGSGKRIAILVSDTIQGATFASRLRRHGIKATVLSSLRNREAHLQSIHWQRSLDATGWKLSALGDLADGFSTACPLDGAQPDPEVVKGEPEGRRFPTFPEKQCHRIYQTPPTEDDEEGTNPDDVGDNVKARSCPLWTVCPAQQQQRDAVDAQVLIMTPPAFVHITPDKWTTEHHLSIPELLQYEYDLVIVDEVDGVQKALDDVFAPRSPIMGDERNVYAPSIGLRSSEALRERSGVQFRKPVNAKWQSNFFTFFRLIGTIYAILQNEREILGPFFKNTPFTAGSILYDLWRRRSLVLGTARESMTFDNPAFAEGFLDVVRVAGSIKGYSRAASVGEEETEDDAPSFSDPAYGTAALHLQEIARQILVADYYDAVVPLVQDALDHELEIFNAVCEEGPKKLVLDAQANALALLLAVVTDLALSHYNWLIKTQSAVARDFKIDDGHLLGQANSLIKNYRTLLPANPAGAAFGLFYDEPENEQRTSMGGKLTLISHLGVGRHLLTHLHDLLAAEGQAGPHVLMLSGTSWAGGSVRRKDPRSGRPIDAASPSFDVQVPVRGVLVQPEAELKAIKRSVFGLVHVKDGEGHQIRVSGRPQNERRANLAIIAERLAARRDGRNRLEDDWHKMERRWEPGDITGRQRALLVTNSYADAAIVADALSAALDGAGYAGWKVHCLVRDRDDAGTAVEHIRLAQAKPMPRSLIERFGREPERSVLVAPMQVVARGHNILNGDGKAAISSIYFLHRPHPRPDDLGPTIGRLNRFAQERYDKGVKPEDGDEDLARRTRRVRHAASNIVRYGLEAGRFGYRSLPHEFQAQFAWDMLTPLWQTIGRGIRGGSPVRIGFVDYSFAPLSFDGDNKSDTPESSALVQILRQLEMAMDPNINPKEHEVADLLYRPFHDALANTEGLRLG